MNLNTLLKLLGDYETKGSRDISVQNICYNSKEVTPGSLFVAIPGLKTDGRQYVHEAVDKGAGVVVFEGSFFDNLRATQIRVSGARLALAQMSAALYVHPTESFYLAGVTGTNGKTTLTYFLEALWQAAGLKTGVMGTIDYRFGGSRIPAIQTTPESRDLQNYFSQMKKQKVSHVAMEVSSHAVALLRVEACQFDSCVFTNLSQDHLDFHGEMEDYYRTKEGLFTRNLVSSSKAKKMAVINKEQNYGKRLLEKMNNLEIAVITYGLDSDNDVFPRNFKKGLGGFEAVLSYGPNQLKVKSPLMGGFNLLNAMAAVVVGMHSGLSPKEVEKGIANLLFVPGRLERIENKRGLHLFVDYAHTPDALKSVLTELKRLAPKKVITVFGCGGDRDQSKRPKMGFEAADKSDICLVTSDNPRTEDPEKIIDEILPGVKKAGLKPLSQKKGYLVEMDRKKAILEALNLAEKGDIVLIAGKGHEDYQIIGSKKHHFSDQEVIRGILGNK